MPRWAQLELPAAVLFEELLAATAAVLAAGAEEDMLLIELSVEIHRLTEKFSAVASVRRSKIGKTYYLIYCTI